MACLRLQFLIKKLNNFYSVIELGETSFYFINSEGIFFASELKSLAKNVTDSVQASTSGLQLYTILRYVPAPHTILDGFYKLKPGHYICHEVNSSSVIQIPYFSSGSTCIWVPPTQQNYAEVVKATETFLVKSRKVDNVGRAS